MVNSAMCKILPISSPESTGCLASSRIGGDETSIPRRLGRGPIKDTSDITDSSRIESIGGLVTCANICLK